MYHKTEKKPAKQNNRAASPDTTHVRSGSQLQDNRHESLQLKGMLQDLATTPANPLQRKRRPVLEDNRNNIMPVLQQRASPMNNTGIPDKLKNGIENLSGIAMDDVRVHYNSSKPAQLRAHAFAQGSDIHLAPGQDKHLPHEAWHVVQQKQGRVKPTMQLKGNANVNNDTGLENEADRMGKIAGNTTVQAAQVKHVSAGHSVAQLEPISEIITGVTHLVIPVHGSIFNGRESLELHHGDNVVIEPEGAIWSRRGPNQEDRRLREADRTGEQIYEWYPVISVNQRRLTGGPHYLRDETFVTPHHALGVSPPIAQEGLDAIKRANDKNKPSGKKPVMPDLSKVPSEKQKSVEQSYQKNLAKWNKSNTGKSMQELLNIVFQNLGITFEKAAQPYIYKKHPSGVIYTGLAFGSQNELDFVIIQGQDVLIYSAKLNPEQFSPSTDLAHWNEIKKHWAAKKFESRRGNALKAPPQNPPLILSLSPHTFGINGMQFLEMIVPNWRALLGHADM